MNRVFGGRCFVSAAVLTHRTCHHRSRSSSLKCYKGRIPHLFLTRTVARHSKYQMKSRRAHWWWAPSRPFGGAQDMPQPTFSDLSPGTHSQADRMPQGQMGHVSRDKRPFIGRRPPRTIGLWQPPLQRRRERSRGAGGRTKQAPAQTDVEKAREADPHRFNTGSPVALATDVPSELGHHADALVQRGHLGR
jgi:hypothetical protein